MFMFEFRSIGWWYWLATVCLLTAGLGGWSTGFSVAVAVTGVQIIHFALRDRSVTSFTVQVRLAYLLLILVALPEPLQWIYWLPTAGTWALVMFGYCTMARTVSLLPWNRKEALTLALIKRTFLSRPVKGSILQRNV